MVAHITKVLWGSQDNARRQPICVRDGHRRWTGAIRTSENSEQAKFAEFLF